MQKDGFSIYTGARTEKIHTPVVCFNPTRSLNFSLMTFLITAWTYKRTRRLHRAATFRHITF